MNISGLVNNLRKLGTFVEANMSLSVTVVAVPMTIATLAILIFGHHPVS